MRAGNQLNDSAALGRDVLKNIYTTRTGKLWY